MSDKLERHLEGTVLTDGEGGVEMVGGLMEELERLRQPLTIIWRM